MMGFNRRTPWQCKTAALARLWRQRAGSPATFDRRTGIFLVAAGPGAWRGVQGRRCHITRPCLVARLATPRTDIDAVLRNRMPCQSLSWPYTFHEGILLATEEPPV